MTAYFLDTSIFMYAGGKTHPYKKPCVEILKSMAQGMLEGISDCEVVQEILYRFIRIGKIDSGIKLAREVMKILPHLLPVEKEDVWLASDLLSAHKSIEARDAIHAAVMLNHGISLIISPDKHFDHIKQVKRIDPRDLNVG